MFRTFKNTAVCVLLAAIILTGCSASVKDSVGNVAVENGWFYRISDTPMVYDKDTRIMYYLFSKCTGNQGYGYMSPYYNGSVIPAGKGRTGSSAPTNRIRTLS